jgi:hypothetical protein
MSVVEDDASGPDLVYPQALGKVLQAQEDGNQQQAGEDGQRASGDESAAVGER